MVASKPIEYPSLAMEEMVYFDGLRRVKPSDAYRSWAWLWLNVRHGAYKSLAEIADKE